MKNECEKKLKKLTERKHIFFTDKGNTSIKLALKLVKHLGKNKLFIQDQGGWITYEQFAQQLKLSIIKIKTDYGRVTEMPDLDENSVLLINSMPGYFRLQEDIEEISKKGFVINDVSGSIGTKYAKHGDLVIGSFGRWKPINLEYGGFIAFDDNYKQFFKDNFNKELKDFYNELNEKLVNLDNRFKEFAAIKQRVLKELKEYDLIPGKGINVIVRFNNDEQKNKIISYCEKNNYEYTLCPRYIRIMEDAVSIEIKRL